MNLLAASEYFLAFWAMLLMSIGGVGVAMKAYEIVCKTSDALTITRSVTESMLDKVKEEKKEQ